MLKSRILVENALLAATVCLLTMFLRLPLPLPQGYIHLGDTAIFMGALLLRRKSAPAAGIGSALADLFGYAIYAPATAVIKGLMGFFAGLAVDRSESPVFIGLAFVLSGLCMALGYLAYEWILFGWPVAVASLLPNLGQGVASAVLGLFTLPLMRRVRSSLPG